MTEPAMFTHTDAEGDSLVIRDGGERGALVDLLNGPDTYGAYVNADEAPEVALALLKTAGIEPSEDGNPLEAAAYFLAEAVAELAEAMKEADDAELEAEALALFNAATESNYAYFPLDLVRNTWLRTARKARELHSN
ncbi:hypothetical protein PQE18_gp52 [Arthrobacter phage DrSierra]|uniref:Uncharacterized protein n=1 Tax=Arthrobacter phage DrSierra TaxID=2704034 RepID=A0A6G6XL87_9CAUD|nr:hypothetical protein PQE18_gp52 [Arthrobacter phage DrSierra]QIG58530.1 hypothetical protein SEA_DRSIERRA_52 [Arthrobacter phage DrSierra]